MDEHAEQAPEKPLSRADRRKLRRWNEQVKLASTLCHSLALAVLGFGFLRFVFETDAVWPSLAQTITVIAFAVVAEGFAFYILSYSEAES